MDPVTDRPAPAPRQLDADRLYRLVDVGRSLMGTLDFETILGRVVEVAQEVTGARYGALGIYDERRHELSRFITRGIDADAAELIGDLPRGHGVLGQLLENPVPLRLADIGMHPSSYGFPLDHPPMASFLGAPIIVRERVWGSIYLTEKRGAGEFDAADEEAVLVLADWAALAIANARSYEGVRGRRDELERAVSTLEATTMISSVLGGTTDLDRVLELVVKRARALIEARSVAIYMHEATELLVAHAAGELAAQIVGTRVPVDGSVLGQVLRSRRAVRVADLGPHSASRGDDGRGAGALIVPLVFRDQAYGVLAALDPAERAEFSSEDERLLVAFATSAASAIATARSYEHGLLRRSIQATENERGRWAHELREHTLAPLARVRDELSAVRENSARRQLEDALGGALDELGTQIDALGWVVTQLRPPQLDELGVQASLEALFERVDQTGLVVDGSIALAAEPANRLESAIEVTVFRVVQEALDNALRHGAARRAAVRLEENAGELFLTVTDDGSGFDLAAESDGFGFVDMRERLALVGGVLELRSAPGDGTTVTARIPARRTGRPAAVAPGIPAG
ncbi:MAG: GAF domain-containing protein [Thermoleophilia bacterium]